MRIICARMRRVCTLEKAQELFHSESEGLDCGWYELMLLELLQPLHVPFCGLEDPSVPALFGYLPRTNCP